MLYQKELNFTYYKNVTKIYNYGYVSRYGPECIRLRKNNIDEYCPKQKKQMME